MSFGKRGGMGRVNACKFIFLKTMARLNKVIDFKSFCLKAGWLRPYNATTVNPLRKISFGFFSILAALKPNFPKVAYVSTGGDASIRLF